MRSRNPGRAGHRPGPGPADGDTASEWSGPSQLLHLRLPAHRIEQLRALADDQGLLATVMVSNWVLEQLAEHDPEDALLPIPSRASASGDRLASVTRLPGFPAVDAHAGPAQHHGTLPQTAANHAVTNHAVTNHAVTNHAVTNHAAARLATARRRPPGSEAHPAGGRLTNPLVPGPNAMDPDPLDAH